MSNVIPFPTDPIEFSYGDCGSLAALCDTAAEAKRTAKTLAAVGAEVVDGEWVFVTPENTTAAEKLIGQLQNMAVVDGDDEIEEDDE